MVGKQFVAAKANRRRYDADVMQNRAEQHSFLRRKSEST